MVKLACIEIFLIEFFLQVLNTLIIPDPPHSPFSCYLLPSSLHEMIIIPKDLGMTPKEMGEMVREVNQKEVARDEILSDRIYEFDKEKRQLCQIPESIEKAKEMER